MPELPEVETVRRELLSGTDHRGPSPVGGRIKEVDLRSPEVVELPASADEFRARVVGQLITGIERRGKYLIFALTDGDLIFHLRMSGDVRVGPASTDVEKPGRVVCHLDDGNSLSFLSTRKLSRIYAVPSHEQVTGGLGPEPLDPKFRPADLAELLRNRTRNLKSFLMDQTLIAGIGNIYASEILHHAGLLPTRESGSLSWEEVWKLRESIRAVLQEAVDQSGTSIDYAYEGGGYQNSLLVYGREGEPCSTCAGPIQRLVIGARSTYFCENCQS
jgi:formamidopyrimidine-DNA glycosylase